MFQEPIEIKCTNFQYCGSKFDIGPYYDMGYCSMECVLMDFLLEYKVPNKKQLNVLLETMKQKNKLYKPPFYSSLGRFEFKVQIIKKKNYWNTILMPQLKHLHYFEVVCLSDLKIGVTKSLDFPDCFCDTKNGWAFFTKGQLRHDNCSMGKKFGWSIAKGNVVGILFNQQEGTLKYFDNQAYMGTAFRDVKLTQGEFYLAIGSRDENQLEIKSKGVPNYVLNNKIVQ